MVRRTYAAVHGRTCGVANEIETIARFAVVLPLVAHAGCRISIEDTFTPLEFATQSACPGKPCASIVAPLPRRLTFVAFWISMNAKSERQPVGLPTGRTKSASLGAGICSSTPGASSSLLWLGGDSTPLR